MVGKTRIAWIDIAKALGIFLVFYGHLLETMYQYGGRPFLFPQLKFIYAFHMPLFFVISGYLYRESGLPFSRFFRLHFLTRIVPFFFFNLLSLSALLVQQIGRGGVNWAGVAQSCLALLRGNPSFNMLTWFLACLFMVELIHFGMKRWLTSSFRLFWAILLAFAVGLPVARWAAQDLAATGDYFNIWYIQEAMTALGFYLMGRWGRQMIMNKSQYQKQIILRFTKIDSGILASLKVFSLRRVRRLQKLRKWGGDYQRVVMGGVMLLLFGVTWVTAEWNQGPFVTDPGLVLMSISSQGSFVWFPITAVTGTLSLILLATLIPSNQVLCYFGQKTLVLLGMGGLFFEFFNQPLVAITNPFFPASPLVTMTQAVLLTVLSFAICVPFIYVFEKYVPYLVGKPKRT